MLHHPYISYVLHRPPVVNALMNVWGFGYLVAGPILLFGGAPAAGSALVGSVVGCGVGLLVVGSDIGSLPYRVVFASLPYGAVVGASIGAVVFGLVGLAWRPADAPLARHLNTLALATAIVGTLVVFGVHFVAPRLCFSGPWAFHVGPADFYFPRPHSGGSCLPKFALWAQALLAFDVAFLALLFLLQARWSSTRTRYQPVRSILGLTTEGRQGAS
jgi:hypothetical protein